MGRESRALITKSLPEMEDRIEIFVARAHLEHRWGPSDDQVEKEHLATMLLSFDPTPGDRWAARATAGRYIAAETSFWQKPSDIGLSQWMAQVFTSIPRGSSLAVVLALPDEWSADIEDQVFELLTRIRCGDHEIQLVAGIASETTRFSWWRGSHRRPVTGRTAAVLTGSSGANRANEAPQHWQSGIWSAL